MDSEVEKYSNKWMLNHIKNCEANEEGTCEVYWEACDAQCITDSARFKEHQEDFMKVREAKEEKS